MCKVSVVLPVYNVAPYIQNTIESILRQTFQDFELLVLDDCSTDSTVELVRAFADLRLKLIVNPRNLGRAGTDNAALEYVRGEYIAKMDGDDICHPERLAQQVAFLDSHHDVNVVGTWVVNFGASTYLNCYPITLEAARVRTLFTMPVGNPSVMLRTALFREREFRYDDNLRQTEDYDFFCRYIRELRVANLPQPLLQYRVPVAANKERILAERTSVADGVRTKLLHDWGLIPTDRELHIHHTISMLERPLGDITLDEIEKWLYKLLAFNKVQPLFNVAALRYGLGERWFEACYTYQQSLFGSWRKYKRSSLATYYPLTRTHQLKFWAKAVQKFY
jgi:glycosyltransferase involved in cell wall biosynthesis